MRQTIAFAGDGLVVDPGAGNRAVIQKKETAVFSQSQPGVDRGDGRVIQNLAALGGVCAKNDLLFGKWDRCDGKNLSLGTDADERSWSIHFGLCLGCGFPRDDSPSLGFDSG